MTEYGLVRKDSNGDACVVGNGRQRWDWDEGRGQYSGVDSRQKKGIVGCGWRVEEGIQTPLPSLPLRVYSSPPVCLFSCISPFSTNPLFVHMSMMQTTLCPSLFLFPSPLGLPDSLSFTLPSLWPPYSCLSRLVFLFTLSLGSVRYLPITLISGLFFRTHAHSVFCTQSSTQHPLTHFPHYFSLKNTPLSLPFSYITTIMFSYLAFIIY